MKNGKHPIQNLILLILAGEAIFILPFVLARVFRHTFLAVFELTNLELGSCVSVYGIVALVSYFLGGPLADRFSPKLLIGVALLLTSVGGFVMAVFPSLSVLRVIYSYWGFTTIFLFWAPMIKATRVWGGTGKQGKAFGFLDGGRGLVAAGIGSLGILIYAIFLGDDFEHFTLQESKNAFKYVIWFSSLFVGMIGILVLLFIRTYPETKSSSGLFALSDIKRALRLPNVWLLMVVVLCAYVGYKITDIFPQYGKEIMKYDEIESAKVGTFLLYLRPVIGISIGFLADRTRVSLWLIVGFSIMLVSSVFMAIGIIQPSSGIIFLIVTISMGIGVYAVRVLYFAALQEGNIPLQITGTAVGFISVIGFTPDIFVGPMIGYFLDKYNGVVGFQYVFGILTLFSLVGMSSGIIMKASRFNSFRLPG